MAARNEEAPLADAPSTAAAEVRGDDAWGGDSSEMRSPVGGGGTNDGVDSGGDADAAQRAATWRLRLAWRRAHSLPDEPETAFTVSAGAATVAGDDCAATHARTAAQGATSTTDADGTAGDSYEGAVADSSAGAA